jgi:glycine dehydrogenase subunit 1
MTHRYLPMTERDREAMLREIGVSTVEELFADIPAEVRFKGRLAVSEAMSEPELMRHMRKLAGKNYDFDRYVSFLGAGLYDHHIPSVVNHVISRSEFYTAYTPYQPEISQGELQAIFEFQSYIVELTGMRIANASMYDGATAAAEACSLAHGATKRNRIVVSKGLHPEARRVIAVTARGLNLELVEAPVNGGVTDAAALEQLIDDRCAAIVIQTPNFFGCIENVAAASERAHAVGALSIVSCNPLALGLLEPPGKLGADIAVGDAQPLGISPSMGGPTCGFFAVQEPLMRRMPGRIVGQTVDRDGKRGFVLTLQAREQHIRREKATSNICSNQALLALAASVYMSVMGKQGLWEVAEQNVRKAHYAADVLAESGFPLVFPEAPFFNEFAIRLPEGTDFAAVSESLLKHGILCGFPVHEEYPEYPNTMLVAVTEQRTKQEIDAFAALLKGACRA